MRKCIWCNSNELNVSFKKKAHTVPQSLGGKNICLNVCDDCNAYFGNRSNGKPAVEVILKEFLHLSQYILLSTINQPIRHKSEYFDINKKTNQVGIKMKYRLIQNFQETIIRQFKRGLYKVFLEERDRQKQDAYNERFNFIREFARYDLLDYPVFYVKPFQGAVFFQTDDAKHPTIRFTEYSDEMDIDFRMFEYTILGHRIVIPTSPLYYINFKKFVTYIKKQNVKLMGEDIVEIKSINDIDFLFEHVKNN